MTSRTKDLYEKEGKVNTSIPRAGERILKVTKKSGNRGRCRKLSLWSSSFWSWATTYDLETLPLEQLSCLWRDPFLLQREVFLFPFPISPTIMVFIFVRLMGGGMGRGSMAELIWEKIPDEGEFSLRIDPWAGLIASCGSFYPMVSMSCFFLQAHRSFL